MNSILCYFWATICKTVRPILLDHCLSVCPVCDVGVLWPNGWMDQDETWHRGRPRPRPHCARWGPSSPPQKWQTPPNFWDVCCSQMAGWIKMLLGTEVDLDPGHTVLDGAQQPPLFSAHVYCGPVVACLSYRRALIKLNICINKQ